MFPSEFQHEVDYIEVFEKHGLNISNIVSGSKSQYKNKYPDNLVIFNSNVITEKSGKIWYGDLDITLSFDILKNIADELKEDLYILYEMDGRFTNDNKPFKYYKSKAKTIIKTRK